MPYLSFNKLGESEFDGIVSKSDKLQDLKSKQLKLEVNDTYKKDENITTNFEATDDSDVINKSYLDEKYKKKMVMFLILKKITTSLNYNTTNNQ